MANEYIYHPVLSTDLAKESPYGYGTGFWLAGYYAAPDPGSLLGAIRFPSVTLSPKTVSNALLVLHIVTAQPSSNANVKFKIWGIKQTNTANFSSSPFGRPRTVETVSVEFGDPHSDTMAELSIFRIIDEIVNQSGWNSGNAIGLVWENNGTATDQDRWVYGNDDLSYLMIRPETVPDFTPTPTTVAAPSLPAAENWGIKISKPGSSVLDCPEEDLYFTTRKKLIKIYAEDIYTSTGAGNTTIAHNLGYVPMVTVFGLEVGGNWNRLPVPTYFTDRLTYYVDDTNLYLHSAASGEKFYYRIFVDKITT